MLLPLRMRDNHLVRGLCQQSLITVKANIPPPEVIAHDEDDVGFVCRLGCDGNQAKRQRSKEMPEPFHARQHSLAKRGSNSVAAATPADHGPGCWGLDTTAVNVALHHGAAAPVASVELSDFFVVFCFCNFAVLECGGIFPKLRLIGGLEFAQFAIRGAAGEKQTGEKQHDKVENRFHDARRVRLAKPVVKQPSRKTGVNPYLPKKPCFSAAKCWILGGQSSVKLAHILL